jgi:hypothetical protein
MPVLPKSSCNLCRIISKCDANSYEISLASLTIAPNLRFIVTITEIDDDDSNGLNRQEIGVFLVIGFVIVRTVQDEAANLYDRVEPVFLDEHGTLEIPTRYRILHHDHNESMRVTHSIVLAAR